MKGWTELCKHPKAVIALIVHEFYSNLCGEGDGTIFVQGKWFLFGKNEINEYYKLQNENYE